MSHSAQAQASRALICHNSLRLSHSDYPVPAVRNVTFANRILDGDIEWSTLSGTLMSHSAQAQASRTLSYVTTLYGFPIKTIQCWRSEMWLLQNAFSAGI